MKKRFSYLRRKLMEDLLGERLEEYINFNRDIPSIKKRNHRQLIPLWKFMLHLLHRDVGSKYVEWSKENPLQFQIKDPTFVAKLWGSMKYKLHMTYEKLARAMRYYYGKDIIEKVIGKQYSYRFILSRKTEKCISQFMKTDGINGPQLGRPIMSPRRCGDTIDDSESVSSLTSDESDVSSTCFTSDQYEDEKTDEDNEKTLSPQKMETTYESDFHQSDEPVNCKRPILPYHVFKMQYLNQLQPSSPQPLYAITLALNELPNSSIENVTVSSVRNDRRAEPANICEDAMSKCNNLIDSNEAKTQRSAIGPETEASESFQKSDDDVEVSLACPTYSSDHDLMQERRDESLFDFYLLASEGNHELTPELDFKDCKFKQEDPFMGCDDVYSDYSIAWSPLCNIFEEENDK